MFGRSHDVPHLPYYETQALPPLEESPAPNLRAYYYGGIFFTKFTEVLGNLYVGNPPDRASSYLFFSIAGLGLIRAHLKYELSMRRRVSLNHIKALFGTFVGAAVSTDLLDLVLGGDHGWLAPLLMVGGKLAVDELQMNPSQLSERISTNVSSWWNRHRYAPVATTAAASDHLRGLERDTNLRRRPPV